MDEGKDTDRREMTIRLAPENAKLLDGMAKEFEISRNRVINEAILIAAKVAGTALRGGKVIIIDSNGNSSPLTGGALMPIDIEASPFLSSEE